jgi:hypothetical protein
MCEKHRENNYERKGLALADFQFQSPTITIAELQSSSPIALFQRELCKIITKKAQRVLKELKALGATKAIPILNRLAEGHVDLNIVIYEQSNFVVVELSSPLSLEKYIGITKRNPNDSKDFNRGVVVATTRAVENMARFFNPLRYTLKEQ